MKHYFRILFISLVVPLFLLSWNEASATTEAECKKRIITAMENAAAIGADEAKWGRNAASNCGTSTLVNETKKDDGLWSLIVWIVGLIAAIWFLYSLYINGLLPFQRNPEKELKDSLKKMDDDDERALASLDQFQISKLTVEEIAARSGEETSRVQGALRRRLWKCADFDGEESRRRLDEIYARRVLSKDTQK